MRRPRVLPFRFEGAVGRGAYPDAVVRDGHLGDDNERDSEDIRASALREAKTVDSYIFAIQRDEEGKVRIAN